MNINGLPSFNSHPKNEAIYQALQRNEIDSFRMAEVNKNWRKIRERHSWQRRTRGWWEAAKTTIAYNTQDCVVNSDFQPGGCIISCLNRVAHRVIKAGVDETKLGRWSWI